MDAQRLANLPSVRRQNLLVEFSSLKYASLQGVYLSLTPGDPSLWTGVIFVRRGPYARAILRVRINFPATYPSQPPLVTFGTDIFHPLLTPLTTYTYTTRTTDSDTVSATDEERLPAGGFSLRHGFPQWFARSRSNDVFSSKVRGGQTSSDKVIDSGEPRLLHHRAPKTSTIRNISPLSSEISSRRSRSPDSSVPDVRISRTPVRRPVSTVELVRYIRSAFDDETVLDSVPLEAAGNPGAWHAWRSHRLKTHPTLHTALHETNPDYDSESDEETDGHSLGFQRLAGGTSVSGARRPGEWNWEGVWEERVKKGIEGSLAEPILFGNVGGADELIRFLNMDDDMIDIVKDNIRRSVNVDDKG
ncbi:MAG: hypothetical protein M1837_002179 [Sclerophora amabilis]|nr:MAG: hypothetical protein M1837_002179 [Sclerophora amabilis]